VLAPYADQGLILARDADDVRVCLENFLVAVADDRVVGCVALRDFGDGLEEIRSLAVLADMSGQGIGSMLVQAALAFAADPEVTSVESPDGILTVEGLSRVTQPFTIDLTDPAGGDVLIGPIYDISPSQIVLDEPVALTFELLDYEDSDSIVDILL